ncbi:hypothetical protein BGW41_002551 [Actinomortierella wolfii]|nr:hypothetical protein BGW41_002551 [Actinomortierella wolfii]
MPPSKMNQLLLKLPPPVLQYAANLISFYFQHVRPHQAIVKKYVRRVILLVLLLNIKSLPGMFHAKMGLRIASTQLYSIRHAKPFRIKPTDSSIVRERVWVDDLDLNFHFSNSSYGKNCDYARVKYVISLFGPSVLPLHPMRRIAFALGGNQYFFKKEITLFQSYEIRTRLIAWSPKWFIIQHSMYTPSKGNNQTLCAVGISKFVLKHARGSWKGKTIPFLDALEMVGHDTTELRRLEALSKDGKVVLLHGDDSEESLAFANFQGWTDRDAAIGNGFDLCERMRSQKALDHVTRPRFRNQYDNDISTWSPQGRLHQIEYALEAVKQGSAAVGLRSNTHVVILALKRSSGELAAHQQKLFRIDNHMGIAIAGLVSDARVLSNFMRTECMKSKMLYDRPLPGSRLVAMIGDKAQINTQNYGRRPYGVGLLVGSYDEETGPHLYECLPNANCLEYYAVSIGAKSQSAKTYLEKFAKEFPEANEDALILHGLHALRETLQQEKELNLNNTAIGIVGKDKDWELIEGDRLKAYLDRLEAGAETSTTATGDAPAAGASTDENAMETD